MDRVEAGRVVRAVGAGLLTEPVERLLRFVADTEVRTVVGAGGVEYVVAVEAWLEGDEVIRVFVLAHTDAESFRSPVSWMAEVRR